MQVLEASAPLRRSPGFDAPLETEALFGETVTVYDESEGWAWVQLDRDGYVGYLPARRARRAGRADPPGLGAPHPRLSRAVDQAAAADGAVARRAARRSPRGRATSPSTTDGLHLWARHLAEVESRRAGFRRGRGDVPPRALSLGRADVGGDRLFGARPDRADGGRRRRAARQRHAGGGARRAGAAGRAARCAAISCSGRAMSASCATPTTLLHANGWHMAVVSEPLAEARARIAASGGGDVTGVRRSAAV